MDQLAAGEVGFITAQIKEVAQAAVGDPGLADGSPNALALSTYRMRSMNHALEPRAAI